MSEELKHAALHTLKAIEEYEKTPVELRVVWPGEELQELGQALNAYQDWETIFEVRIRGISMAHADSLDDAVAISTDLLMYGDAQIYEIHRRLAAEINECPIQ